jgi:protein tyrosine/serine phosphatase
LTWDFFPIYIGWEFVPIYQETALGGNCGGWGGDFSPMRIGPRSISIPGTAAFKKCALFCLAVILVVPTSYGIYRWEQGNFAVVSTDAVYRSRQLDAHELADIIRHYRIRSILNLRGKNHGADWYREEVWAAGILNVRLYDYGISANRDLDESEIADLIAILHDAPKPLLIHCKSGADRTSLVAALYLYEVEGISSSTASHQLSLLYGHLPALLGTSTQAMDRTFWRHVGGYPLLR